MALHESQLSEIAPYVPDSRGGIAAGCRQSLAVAVESEIQNFVVVPQQGGQARIRSRLPHLRTFVHRGRRDQRTIEIIEAVGQLRAVADQHARPSGIVRQQYSSSSIPHLAYKGKRRIAKKEINSNILLWIYYYYYITILKKMWFLHYNANEREKADLKRVERSFDFYYFAMRILRALLYSWNSKIRYCTDKRKTHANVLVSQMFTVPSKEPDMSWFPSSL